MAVQAFAAGTEYYCNGCTLSSSGVPAVSSERWTWENNAIGFQDLEYWQIYMYNANLNETYCPKSGYSTGSFYACAPPGKATARCHLLYGYGPDTAYCYAYYSGG